MIKEMVLELCIGLIQIKLLLVFGEMENKLELENACLVKKFNLDFGILIIKFFFFNENYFLIYISYWNLYDIYSPYFHFFNFKLTDVQFFFDNNDFSEGLN